MQLIGSGRNRTVYRHGNYVVKFPHNSQGVHDNYRERDLCRIGQRKDTYIKYARCRLMGQVLIMQYVDYISQEERPEWADFVDCGQVGRNRFGKIVAYDYAG